MRAEVTRAAARRRVRRVAAGLVGALVALGGAAIGPAQAQAGGPGAAEGGASASADAVEVRAPVERHRGYPVVAVESLRGGALTDVGFRGRRFRARLEGRPLEFHEGSPFYEEDGELRQLANPPYREGGRFWIPVEFFVRAHPEVSRLSGSVGARALVVAPRPPEPRGPWTVVIDPGHGGRDPGASGVSGTPEKEVVLAIARRVRAHLAEVPDIEAVLTRSADEFVPLSERSRMAIGEEANLFLSVHANSHSSRSARGFETYLLGEGRTEEARQVAIRENSAVQYEEEGATPAMDDVQKILAGANLRDHQRESSYIAGYIQNELRGALAGTIDRGVKQHLFLVLVEASGSMPAVLAEVGFLTNPADERMLRSRDGRERIARALSDAVIAYYEKDYSRRVAGSAP